MQHFLDLIKKSRRGKFKIYIGMIAGVGKSYRMLQEAHDLLDNGVDVQIGYIETHGRAGTEALLAGLPVIPRRRIFYKGKELEEMDLEGIIRIHPEIVIVDELAHTNVEGSRNEKRWQDVMDLLDEGINVISAVNIQHIESVNEEVQGISGIEVKERIPDSVLQEADEVVNIDLTDSGGAGLPASQYLALGSGFVVKYSVGVGTAGGGTVDGYSDLKARVIVKRGSTVISEFRDAEFVGVTAGQSYTFDASPYLKDATAYTVQVEAQATYQDGTLMKTATAKVTMVAMELETTYSAGNGLADGGYKNDVNIPFTAKGTSGEKNIYYRVNGGQAFTLGLSAGSGVQQKNVTIPLTQMQEGTNVVEAYAQHENSGVVSRVHYITLLKAGGGVTAYAGLMFSHRAAGFQRDWKHPVLEAEQFTAWNFTYAGYDRDAYTARVKVTDRGSVVKEDLLQRGETGSYGRTNVNVEPLDYRVSCGDAVLEVQVNTTSHPDIEATLAPDAVCTFDAFGRSNTENNPASWVSGDKRMEFRDVLWSVNEYGAGSGWHKDRLLLAGGAGMTLTADGGYRPSTRRTSPRDLPSVTWA